MRHWSEDVLNKALPKTQFGDLIVSNKVPDTYVTSTRGVNPYHDSVFQIDGSPLGSASVEQDGANGQILMQSGTVASESVVLQTNKNLDYTAGREAEGQMYIQIPTMPTANQVVRFGMFTLEDGWFYQVTSTDISFVLRDNSNDYVIESSDPTLVDAPDKSLSEKTDGRQLRSDLLTVGNTWWGRYAWYGAGQISGGQDEPPVVRFGNYKDTKAVFKTYDPRKDDTDSNQPFRTPHLPMRVEIENDSQNSGISPNNLEVFVGERQMSLLGGNLPVTTPSAQKFKALPVDSSTWTPLIVLRPKERYAGRPNDVNVYFSEVIGRSLNNITEFELSVGNSIDEANITFDESNYPNVGAAEIASANGDLDIADVVRDTEKVIPPMFESGKRVEDPLKEKKFRQVLGRAQPLVLWGKGDGCDVILEWEENR